LAVLVARPISAHAGEDVAEFYSGKTVRIIVGTSSGGGFDASGRLLARLLPDHIPGHPNVVVQNMPGGSSLRAANYVYNAAPEDGTNLGIFNHSLILQTIVDPRSTQFDMQAFQWVGRIAIDDLVGIVSSSIGVRSLEDAKRREVIIGANSGNSSSSMVPLALNHLLGAKFKIVAGYPGQAERYLALERGEIDGISGASWSYINETRKSWITERKIVVLHQNALERAPNLPDVPTLVELANSPDERKVLALLGLTETIGKSIAFGPKVPVALVEAMRGAFDETVADPAFAEDARSLGLIPAAMPGKRLAGIIAKSGAEITPAFAERFKQAIAP
jgi:tripartite-type tricarboxylate transporter receptor subunit TctC